MLWYFLKAWKSIFTLVYQNWVDMVLTFVWIFIFAILISLIVAISISAIWRENKLPKIGVESIVNFSWAWGFTIYAVVVIGVVAYLVYFGQLVGTGWGGFIKLIPHLAIIGLLFLFASLSISKT